MEKKCFHFLFSDKNNGKIDNHYNLPFNSSRISWNILTRKGRTSPQTHTSSIIYLLLTRTEFDDSSKKVFNPRKCSFLYLQIAQGTRFIFERVLTILFIRASVTYCQALVQVKVQADSCSISCQCQVISRSIKKSLTCS